MFGDAVEHASGTAATKDHAAGALRHFEAFDVVEIAVVLDVVAEAIDEVVAGGTVATEDDGVAVALALGGAKAGDVAGGFADAGRGGIAEELLGEDGDGLRRVEERSVGLGGEAGVGCVVALVSQALDFDFFEPDGSLGGRALAGEAGGGSGDKDKAQETGADAGDRRHKASTLTGAGRGMLTDPCVRFAQSCGERARTGAGAGMRPGTWGGVCSRINYAG